MKVLLFVDNEKTFKNSGVGRAMSHQRKALELNNIKYTTDPNDEYDIVHINTYMPNDIKMAKKAHKLGKKVVYHAHSTKEDSKNSFAFSNLIIPVWFQWLRHAYKKGDLILTPTPYSKALLDTYSLNKEVVAISNGIDLEFFKKDKKLANEFRRKYKFKDTDKVIMNIGWYFERKGFTEFIELASRLPEYKFIWFGFTKPAARTNTVKAAIKKAATLDNVYLPGYVSKDEIKGALSGADLYIFTSFEETEGIVLLEALATKIPVIIRDIPIYEEWLEDKKNIYKAKDINDFEKLIKDYLNGKLKDLTEEGYKIAQKRDIKEIGKELKSAYNKVLEK